MTSKTRSKFSLEVRSRAVRLVLNHEVEHPSRWSAIMSLGAKIGCTAQTLNEWVKKAPVDSGRRARIGFAPADRDGPTIIVAHPVLLGRALRGHS